MCNNNVIKQIIKFITFFFFFSKTAHSKRENTAFFSTIMPKKKPAFPLWHINHTVNTITTEKWCFVPLKSQKTMCGDLYLRNRWSKLPLLVEEGK